MLEIRHVSIAYGKTQTVNDVTLSLKEGEIVGIVGESGSGKSTLMKSILGLLSGGGRVISGEIMFYGEDLLKFSSQKRRKIRGKEIAIVFQHPELSLDPLWTIGKTFYESIRVHRNITKADSENEARMLLEELELPDPEKILRCYPFELSGGMCQRVAIAIAMANHPDILLADEPTSALDVTVQKQVIEIMMKMREKFGTSILIVSHNMGVIAKMADKVGVMKHGDLVEWGKKEEVLYSPKHEYTRALIRAIPKMDGKRPEAVEEIENG